MAAARVRGGRGRARGDRVAGRRPGDQQRVPPRRPGRDLDQAHPRSRHASRSARGARRSGRSSPGACGAARRTTGRRPGPLRRASPLGAGGAARAGSACGGARSGRLGQVPRTVRVRTVVTVAEPVTRSIRAWARARGRCVSTAPVGDAAAGRGRRSRPRRGRHPRTGRCLPTCRPRFVGPRAAGRTRVRARVARWRSRSGLILRQHARGNGAAAARRSRSRGARPAQPPPRPPPAAGRAPARRRPPRPGSASSCPRAHRRVQPTQPGLACRTPAGPSAARRTAVRTRCSACTADAVSAPDTIAGRVERHVPGRAVRLHRGAVVEAPRGSIAARRHDRLVLHRGGHVDHPLGGGHHLGPLGPAPRPPHPVAALRPARTPPPATREAAHAAPRIVPRRSGLRRSGLRRCRLELHRAPLPRVPRC